MARRTGFYLDKRNGKFLGVCAGIADYTGFEVLWVRIAMVLGTVFGGGFLALVYFVMAFAADVKPNTLYVSEESNPDEVEFWQKARAKPSRSIRDVRSTFRDVDRRLRDIELQYTSQNTKLAREIDDLNRT